MPHCFWGRLFSALCCQVRPSVSSDTPKRSVDNSAFTTANIPLHDCYGKNRYVPGIMGPERLRESQDGNKHSLVDSNLETCLSSGGLTQMKKKLHVSSPSSVPSRFDPDPAPDP
ncbi:unnamed protein product [Fusarium graminearum]|nr:unnamed protein product [Fusarium graminearum]